MPRPTAPRRPASHRPCHAASPAASPAASSLALGVMLGVTLGVTLACGDRTALRETALPSTVPDGAHAPATAEDSAMVDEADGAIRAWLDASTLRGADDSVSDSAGTTALVTSACDDGYGESMWPMPVLAHYALLPSEVRGDTVIARASVTTVAEQDHDRRRGEPVRPGSFVARQRVRVDTLEWDVVPGEQGSWRVCNGIRFGTPGSDSTVRWTPEGASLATARALADSVRRSARLTIGGTP